MLNLDFLTSSLQFLEVSGKSSGSPSIIVKELIVVMLVRQLVANSYCFGVCQSQHTASWMVKWHQHYYSLRSSSFSWNVKARYFSVTGADHIKIERLQQGCVRQQANYLYFLLEVVEIGRTARFSSSSAFKDVFLRWQCSLTSFLKCDRTHSSMMACIIHASLLLFQITGRVCMFLPLKYFGVTT